MKCKHVYTDNILEFAKAMDELGFSHDTCTPHRPETNGVAEMLVMKVKRRHQLHAKSEWFCRCMVVSRHAMLVFPRQRF